MGWYSLVHHVSHYAHLRLAYIEGLSGRQRKPHSGSHARLETEMIRYVVAQGWLDGKLKPKPKTSGRTAGT